jgi:signal transduction histidine kinase
MAHLWVCVPFLVIWMIVPEAHKGIADENFVAIQSFLWFVIAYLLVRSWLAFKNPPWLAWEYVFPPIDVAIVSLLIGLGNRDPLSNIGLLYFFPVAQAAGTLSTRWVAVVAAMSLLGTWLATDGLRSEEPFNTAFRYFFIFVLGSLFTKLALAAAALRAQLGIARDRNRIAMEMHDGVQAHLMTLSKQLELAGALALAKPDRAAELAREGSETARLAADELRYLVNRMRAPSLERGFLPALRTFVDTVCTRHGLIYEFEVDGEERLLSRESEHAAFRIAQEALTNSVRHASASRIAVKVVYDESELTLAVQDNGAGCDPDIESEGLDGMRHRARDAGGTLTISSDGGTRVEATLPISKETKNQ